MPEMYAFQYWYFDMAPSYMRQLQSFKITAWLSIRIVHNVHKEFGSNYFQVLPGVGFSSTYAYAAITNQPAAISSVDFDFLTYETSGILMFVQQRQVSVYNASSTSECMWCFAL